MSADDNTLEALREALEDEYKARAFYAKVIEAFGPVRPFVNIVEAEDRHARALVALFERFGVEPPVDSWPDRVTAPRTLLEACRLAVDAEIANEALYERLIAQISDPDARAVMHRLQQASQERHLPAFQRCLERVTSGRGCGGAPAGTRPMRSRARQRGKRAFPPG